MGTEGNWGEEEKLLFYFRGSTPHWLLTQLTRIPTGSPGPGQGALAQSQSPQARRRTVAPPRPPPGTLAQAALGCEPGEHLGSLPQSVPCSSDDGHFHSPCHRPQRPDQQLSSQPTRHAEQSKTFYKKQERETKREVQTAQESRVLARKPLSGIRRGLSQGPG